MSTLAIGIEQFGGRPEVVAGLGIGDDMIPLAISQATRLLPMKKGRIIQKARQINPAVRIR